MSKIIPFPKTFIPKAAPCPAPSVGIVRTPTANRQAPRAKREGSRLVRGLWMTVVLVWPILKWVLAIDVLFKLIQAVVFWHEPGTHYGWLLLLHFGVLSALTYYVAWKPKGAQ